MTGRRLRPLTQAPAAPVEAGAVDRAGRSSGPVLAGGLLVAAPAALRIASDAGVPGLVRVSMVVSFLVLFGGGVS